MPTYEYVCRDCGHHLEVVQSFTDDPLQTCERCGGQLRKVFSAAGIIFKGSGYYVTDTRKEAAKATDGGAGGDSKADGGKSDTAKSDSAKSDSTKSDSTKSDSSKSESTGGSSDGASKSASKSA
jgi:putative FmdB family regulatory protein